MILARCWLVLVSLLLAAAPAPALAQSEADIKAKLKSLQPKDYPKDPLEFVVVYPAGGGMDVTARILAKYVEKWTGHKTIVTNKVGGGGMVGHTYLVAAGAQRRPHHRRRCQPVLGRRLPALGRQVRLQEPRAGGLHQLRPGDVDRAQRRPVQGQGLKDIAAYDQGEARRAQGRRGARQLLRVHRPSRSRRSRGGKITKVPFQGGAPSITALLGGHIDVSFGYLAEYKGHLDAGKVKSSA